MQTLNKFTNEKTGTKVAIIEGRRGFFVRWTYTGGEVKFSRPLSSLVEAQIMAAYENEEEAEK